MKAIFSAAPWFPATLTLAAAACAQLSPDDALKAFQHEADVQVELVAAEPLVMSPCAMAFDERGRLFVAENRGYPNMATPPQGDIALLEDTDGDGRIDMRTVFADGLTFPNGVTPWRGGLIVTCAPDVLFFKDTDGDGKADEKRVLLTGFATSGSTQLRVNCPTPGPDGWIYFAAGLSGGEITSPEHPDRPGLKMTADLRWNPQTGDIENADGRSQYGMSFDDFGRRFICMNRLPVQHVVLSSKMLSRNPHLAFSETVQDCNERSVKTGLRGGGDGVRLFPISSNITTADSHAGSFSAACAITIWRDGALPEKYRGCAFSCDPTGNLVHVDKLIPRGATFAAEPLLGGREFLASRDDWHRPVFLATGPDGALYICDMYRKTIEHPDYLPEEIRKRTDFEGGKEMGRIWRVVAAENSAPWLAAPAASGKGGGSAPLIPLAAGAASHGAQRQPLAAALALGDVNTPESTEALARIAASEVDDRWMRAAVLSGIHGRVAEFCRAYLGEMATISNGSMELLMDLGRMVNDGTDPLKQIAKLDGPVSRGDAFDVTAAVLVGISEAAQKRVEIAAGDGGFGSFIPAASRIALDPGADPMRRKLAVRFLARCPWVIAHETLLKLTSQLGGDGLQTAAIRSLAGFDEPEVVPTLLAKDRWANATPEIRETILSALLARSARLDGVLAAVEGGAFPASALSPQRRALFLKHKDAAIRERAEKLFGAAIAGDRTKAFDDTKAALALTAHAEHGREVFKTLCATCHRLDREGYNVGPDLLDMRNQPKESILFHIVVPEAEVAPAFAPYVVETKDGRTLGGILASETAVSLTLRMPLGVEETILRTNVAKLEAAPGSLMPAGLEAAMSRQDLADLLGYLKGER